MHNPSHPGLIIRDDVLPDLQLSVTEAAAQLGVSRVTLSRVINGRSAITAEMALRVGKWVGNGPEIWLRMQGQYDLWQARKKGEPTVKKAKRPAAGAGRAGQLDDGGYWAGGAAGCGSLKLKVGLTACIAATGLQAESETANSFLLT